MNPLNAIKYLPFLLRRKFKEKYIIIESDDWGLERALNKEALDWAGRKFGTDNFSRWTTDSLETPEDMDCLFEILEKYKSKFEYPPVITANFITHNIDYKDKNNLCFKSLSSGFNNEESSGNKKLYDEGIKKKYIFPQLHGYSHYNISSVSDYFETSEGKEAFNNNFFFAKSTIRKNLSFLQGEMSSSNLKSGNIKEAAAEFERYFGFKSKSFIPPTFIFDTDLTEILKQCGIQMLQSSNRLVSSDKNKYSFPYFRKSKGIYRSVRNARLDPHPEYKFFFEQCADSVGKAFETGNPAVIDFHRVNFAGKYAPEYRERTLTELDSLFDIIYKKWPDAKFINSQNLTEILWQQ